MTQTKLYESCSLFLAASCARGGAGFSSFHLVCGAVNSSRETLARTLTEHRKLAPEPIILLRIKPRTRRRDVQPCARKAAERKLERGSE